MLKISKSWAAFLAKIAIFPTIEVQCSKLPTILADIHYLSRFVFLYNYAVEFERPFTSTFKNELRICLGKRLLKVYVII